MGGNTFILSFSLFVFYFATANSSVFVVRAPNLNNTGDIQNNYSKGTERSIETATRENHNECGVDIDYSFFEITNTCYKVHTELETWSDAEATCVREGGHLAVLNSQHEVDFLLKHFPQGHGRVYIGFHWKELNGSGSWVTIQGQSLLEAGYRQWFIGQPEPRPDLTPLQAVYSRLEPNDKYGVCGSLFRDGTLDNAPCENRGAFICEKDAYSQTSVTMSEVPIKDTTEKVPNDPDVCQPSPCGPYSRCREVNQQAACSCLPNYTLTPSGCRPACVSNEDCSKDKACIHYKCQDPCPDTCATNSNCRTINHRPICQCKPQYTGDPFLRCSPIAHTSDEDGTTDTENLSEPTLIKTKCGTTDSGYKWYGNRQSCYKFHTKLATWDKAEATCVREGGHIAVINGPKDRWFFTTLIPPRLGDVWLKYRRNESRTINQNQGEGDAIEYINCVAMNDAGSTVEVPCNYYTFYFICEKDPNSLSATATESETVETDSTETGPLELLTLIEPRTNECGTDTDYKFFKGTKACYRFYKFGIDRETWEHAEATCVREGGHLAVINSQDEADFLVNLMKRLPRDVYQVFLGFHREHGSWMTIQGLHLSETGYENWKEGEPNNISGDQYCGSMYPDGTFDDIECWLKLAFICERKLNFEYLPESTTEVQNRLDNVETDDTTQDDGTPDDEESSGVGDVPEPDFVKDENECGTTDTEYTFYESTQSCYKVHTERATWSDAEATCVREGGHLAVINSQHEADVLTTMYPEGAMHVFVGFRYRERDSEKISDMYARENGVWLTIDGQTLSEAGYESWTPGEPNNAGGREYCGTIYSNGKFDDSACYNRFDFICEIKPNLL